MDISTYIDEYARKKKYYALSCDAETIHKLIKGDGKYSLKSQFDYTNSECLAYNIELSVKRYTRDKDIAINNYKDFCAFLKSKGVEVVVSFPPISVSNSFERLMFISKYLQDPRHKVSELQDLLWVSERTINDDLTKLRGLDNDPIQICGKVFKIDDLERGRDVVYFPSTAHPLFLTPNLTQVLVTLKGLKAMSDDPLYAEYARLAATDIWEQLSDYAKTRIHFVLSELLPEDLDWYENLRKQDDEYFYSEYRCSPNGNVFLDCIKNEKLFCVEYDTDDGVCLYNDCMFVPGSMEDGSFEVDSNKGKVRLHFEKILRSAYTAEELM